MATKTYPQLGVQSGVQAGDLHGSWRSIGPLKTNTWSEMKADAQTDVPGANVTFQQAGTGAGVLTMQAKARQVICVEDFYSGGASDTTAWQRALDRIHALGGGYMRASAPAYAITAKLVFDATSLVSPVVIDGGGCKFTSSGASGILKINGNTNIMGVGIKDIGVDHTTNVDAACAFEQMGTARVTWQRCYVRASSTVLAGYAGWWLRQTNPDDNNTGCFWTSFPNSGVRSDGGTIPNGVILDGAMNATDFATMFLGGGMTNAILMRPAAGTTLGPSSQAIANAVRVVGAWIEGPTNAVAVSGVAGGFGPYGLVIDCRIESVTNALNIQGVTLNPQQPPLVYTHQFSQSVTNYVVNPNALIVNVFDTGYGAGAGSTFSNSLGWTYKAQDGVHAAVTLDQSNVANALGLAFTVNGSNVKGTLSYAASGVLELAGDTGGFVVTSIKSLGGISTGLTRANNVKGVATLVAGTKAVTFAVAEPDASYEVWLQGDASESFRYSSKGTGGFTITSSNGASTARVNWLLVR